MSAKNSNRELNDYSESAENGLIDSKSNLNDGSNKETDRLVSTDEGSDNEVNTATILQRSNASCHQQFTDFSNVFKAFIGSALIGLPFAIRNAGIVLGLIGIALIAIATDHCCTLIVKCKRIVIKKMCQRMAAEGYVEDHIEKQEKILGRTLSFGQIGKVSMGAVGTCLVDTSIVITQIGFCVGYFIFLGNTTRSVLFEFLRYQHIGFSNTTNSFPVNATNVTLLKTIESTVSTRYLTTLAISSSSHTTKTVPEHMKTLPKALNSSGNYTFLENASFDTPIVNVTTFVKLNATSRNETEKHGIINSLILQLKNIKNKVIKMDNPITHNTLQENKVWTFTLLLVVPAPLLILISFIRNLRKLGPVSVLANGSITGAFLATAIYILIDFESPHETITWFNFFKFPVFFGQVTGAFEGIGTVIPIEGSMAENRGRYPCYLHISLFLLSSILGSFGTLGYLRYGNETNQIVTENLKGSAIVIALRCLLFFGVLFTYPLQIYPVIQIVEGLIYGPNSRCSRRLYRSEAIVNKEVDDSSDDGCLKDDVTDLYPVIRVPKWQSNLIRAGLVLFTAAIAVIFRSQFAYVAALTGSIGSSLLSYILPCLFHIILRRRTMSKWILAKDIALIVFGVIGGVMGMTVTIFEIVRTFGTHHQLKHN